MEGSPLRLHCNGEMDSQSLYLPKHLKVNFPKLCTFPSERALPVALPHFTPLSSRLTTSQSYWLSFTLSPLRNALTLNGPKPTTTYLSSHNLKQLQRQASSRPFATCLQNPFCFHTGLIPCSMSAPLQNVKFMKAWNVSLIDHCILGTMSQQMTKQTNPDSLSCLETNFSEILHKV